MARRDLAAKALRCTVTRSVFPNELLVHSQDSDWIYRVYVVAPGSCECEWNRTHRDSMCAHLLAAARFLAVELGLRVSAWESPAQAARQHARQQRIGDLLVTIRGRSTTQLVPARASEQAERGRIAAERLFDRHAQ